MTMTRLLPFLCCLLLLGCFTRSAPPADVYQYNYLKSGSSVGVIQVYDGDNLYRIAQRYKIPLRDLIDENNLSAPYKLQVGQRLSIPSPRIHTARAGDSYSSIAQLYDLSVTDLVKMNNARAPYTIHPNDEIYLSRSKKQPSTVVASQGGKQTSPSSTTPKASPQTVQTAKKVTKINTPPKASGKFSWPVQGKVVSSYGPKKGGLYNDGVNIAAPKGTAVRVAENGVVAYVGSDLKGFGNLVLVKHQNGYVTAYAHLDKSLVERGTELVKGQTLGTVGRTGSVDTPQLHFEVRKNGKAINPMSYLG